MEEKEFDLKDQPWIELKIRFYRAFNENERRGVTSFKIANTDVLDPTTKKVLGNIAASANGTMCLTDNVHLYHAEFMCIAEEVWNAFQEALARQKCPECGMALQHKLQCSRRKDGGQTKLLTSLKTGDDA